MKIVSRICDDVIKEWRYDVIDIIFGTSIVDNLYMNLKILRKLKLLYTLEIKIVSRICGDVIREWCYDVIDNIFGTSIVDYL